MLQERHKTTAAPMLAPPELVRAPIPPQGPPARPEIEAAYRKSRRKFPKVYQYLGTH